MLITDAELQDAIDGFPFEADDAARQPYVVFCSESAVRAELVDAAAPLDAADDPVQGGPAVVYWSPPKGRSVDTPFAKILAKSRYKATTTTRNLRTLAKIAGVSP